MTWGVNFKGGVCMKKEEFAKKYVNEDIFDLLEKGFNNMSRISIEVLQEAELEENNQILPEEKDDCWSY